MTEHSAHPTRSTIVIDVWADMGCPWCYVAKHRLSTALAQRADADRFEIVMRSFQLDPEAPKERERNADSFIRSHGGTEADLLRAERQMQAIARAEGLEYFIDRVNANTFDLHRVVQFAGDEGLGFEFFSRVQDGFFAGTLDPYDPQSLIQTAESVGLDGERVIDVLAGDAYSERVRSDRDAARAFGASGVPFVVVNGELAAAGAQKVEVYAQMLEQAAESAGSERAS